MSRKYYILTNVEVIPKETSHIIGPKFITLILHEEYFKTVVTNHSYTLFIAFLNQQYNCFYLTRHSVNFRMSRPTLILLPLKALTENLKYV